MIRLNNKSVFMTVALLSTVMVTLFASQTEKVTISDLDLSGVQNSQEKKERFFNFMRPIVDAENQKVKKQREQIIAAQKKGDKGFINKMLVKYKLKEGATNAELLMRVNTIPMDLALAQSADESNWGQSRFAQEANNMFGQHCFTQGCGVIPKRRAKGATYEVQSFPSVNASVAAYIYNLNTVSVYQPLRELRTRLLSEGKPVTGMDLAPGLIKYSERGQDYVDDIQKMIRVNQTLMAGTNKN